jgi:hypothetical protein
VTRPQPRRPVPPGGGLSSDQDLAWNDAKPREARLFNIRRGFSLHAIFDIENRGKRHADPDARFVVNGLQPGWSLVSLTV